MIAYALRRIWWATLPFYGWTGPHEECANPCPWWAHPLAWINRAANLMLGKRDVFGPRYHATHGARRNPWQ